MIRFLKKIWDILFEPYGDEAHEKMEKSGYRPSRGHVKETVDGQFVWVEDFPATDISKTKESC